MSIRSGMANLIARLRRMIDDSTAAVWTDDELQEMLDAHMEEVFGSHLASVSKYVNGTIMYKTFLCAYGELEEWFSGEDYWRIYDSAGSTVGTSTYSVNYITGRVTFTSNQEGSARYLDARHYDLNGAAGQAWRERMGMQSSKYSFGADGASYSRSDWFDHCERMAAKYEQKSWAQIVNWERNDGNV